MDRERDLQLLKDEYVLLQNIYEDFDRRVLQIKGWMAAGGAAGAGLAVQHGQSERGLLWLLIAALALCFWFLEWRWKTFQAAHDERITKLEAMFRGERVEPGSEAPFQVFTSWFASYRRLRWRSLPYMFMPSVMVPYVPIIGFCAYMLLGR